MLRNRSAETSLARKGADCAVAEVARAALSATSARAAGGAKGARRANGAVGRRCRGRDGRTGMRASMWVTWDESPEDVADPRVQQGEISSGPPFCRRVCKFLGLARLPCG